MKTILCYGDSNTWGWNPANATRFDKATRWTGILASKLGSEYDVIEEGLGGRTTIYDDPEEGAFKNGETYLLPCLLSHQPLDIVILALGTNDLKAHFNASAQDIANGLGRLISMIQTSGAGRKGRAPEIIIVIPGPLSKNAVNWGVFKGAAEKQVALPACYKALAFQHDARLVDFSEIISNESTDGVHYNAEHHRLIAQLLAKEIVI
jgi:lysophospholipase L1-like esterase